MLLRYHGASTLGTKLQRPIATRMSSFLGVTSLATDAMSGTLRLWRRDLSAQSPSTIRATNTEKVWQQDRGIVFGDKNPGPSATSSRAYSAVSTANIDEELALHSEAEDSYVLSSSLDYSPSEADLETSFLAASDKEDGSWAPSHPPSSGSSGESDGEPFSPMEQLPARQERTESVAVLETRHEAMKFRISPELLEAAKNTTPESPGSYWSHKLYRGPNDEVPRVHYCKHKSTMETVLQKYFMDKEIVGFDIEWQPQASSKLGIKKNVATIQLASEERIAIFHLAQFPGATIDDLVTPSLKRIMEDPKVTKTGVAIKADCTRLRTYLEIDTKGIFELSHLYKLVKYSAAGTTSQVNKKLVSLAVQVEEHLELPLYKGDNIRGSDWTQSVSMDQIQYAASDAYAGLVLYDVLEAKRKQLQPTPPRPYHAELNIPIRLASGLEIPTADEALELEPSAIQSPPRIKTARNTSDTKASKPSEPVHPLVQDASAWATTYRTTHPISLSPKPALSCPPSSLRAYALWHHNPSLNLTEMAALLRTPPLKEATVRNYILEAVRIEGLPFERERLRTILESMPEGANGAARYKGLWKMVHG